MPPPQKVTHIELTLSDGTKISADCEGYYRQALNHDTARDGSGKTRKDRHRWIDHEVQWKSDYEVIPKVTESP